MLGRSLAVGHRLIYGIFSIDGNFVWVGVFISKNSWTTAEQKRSYQSMGKALVKAAFPTEVMLLSNLRGNASEIDKNAPKKPALDLNIMNAIEGRWINVIELFKLEKC
ncbi:hypothetical protein KQX54_017781 [Cotesia glomerata]|uniref:Uncharacterized protein n=1 Tax=Cotesia glomerata TaxID=32391 RepID=A0AAV7J829_COTGL|nr:hypothetical protein KQX54_017781 [Cotesia glomerata]